MMDRIDWIAIMLVAIGVAIIAGLCASFLLSSVTSNG